MENVEIGLGLYTDRALRIMSELIKLINEGRTVYKTYCTLKCIEIRQRPNNELALALNIGKGSPYAGGSIWVYVNSAAEARRKLADLLKYSAMYKCSGRGYTKASDRTCYRFSVGDVTSSEIKTLCDLVAGRRPKDAAFAKELIGEPLDEIEAGLVAAKRDEIEKAKAEANEQIRAATKRHDSNCDGIDAEFSSKYAELLQWKKSMIRKSADELDDVKQGINDALAAKLAQIEEKYK